MLLSTAKDEDLQLCALTRKSLHDDNCQLAFFDEDVELHDELRAHCKHTEDVMSVAL